MSWFNEDFYRKVLKPGHSSYFESPHDRLDPSLFDGTRLRPEVRHKLLWMLEDSLNELFNFAGIDRWLHAWLAGSGITYQWEGGEGDLDVLFGVDMIPFVLENPSFQGIPEDDIAQYVDERLRADLWPKTAGTRFGHRTYEVTFYWNPGTGSDIERIKPYAAYDLREDVWVVDPPTLPHDPHALYPTEWYQAAGRDVNAADTIIRRHDSAASELGSTTPESPRGRNAAAELIRARQAATALFDEIHKGRREAFGAQGHGYSDWHNFRWQHGKATGVIPALRALAEQDKAANDAEEKKLYGGPIDGPDQILMRGMLRYRPGP